MHITKEITGSNNEIRFPVFVFLIGLKFLMFESKQFIDSLVVKTK